MRNLRIALVGGGIAGLSAACALQQRGFRVRVYEQAERLAEVGAGLTVTPNATHVLLALGLGDELARHGMQPARGGARHWRTGRLLAEFERGAGLTERYGAPYLQIHRADLHDALARSVLAHDPQCLLLDHRFESLSQDADGVTIRFANGARAEADVAIGADGIRSAVRAQLFGAGQPRFTGYIAWRGLVPIDALPPGLVDPASCVSIGPQHTFARYLIRAGRVLNYVALAERSDWQVESWSVRSEVGELLAEFKAWHPEVRTIIAATPPELCFKWALFDREPLASWTRGRVTLLGDAAHPMLPFLGQGAAMGIEDAMVLARAFELAGSHDEALRLYEATRIGRTTFVMGKSRETGLEYHRADAEDRATHPHTTAESVGLFSYNPVVAPLQGI
ncbi:MAG TPA: FAD-dependent monooxygenase [Steroidobacteraceae bacterium]|nr:FAD-dependent monooxygenase [Steroidobacteraceae bacterium]HNS26734.1 FAD-dependent monooxygenase [Steroidobacteraceae bacterium]